MGYYDLTREWVQPTVRSKSNVHQQRKQRIVFPLRFLIVSVLLSFVLGFAVQVFAMERVDPSAGFAGSLADKAALTPGIGSAVMAGSTGNRGDGDRVQPARTVHLHTPAAKTVTVQQGDTLWEIASIHAPEDMELHKYIYLIKKKNGLANNSMLQIGDILLLP